MYCCRSSRIPVVRLLLQFLQAQHDDIDVKFPDVSEVSKKASCSFSSTSKMGPTLLVELGCDEATGVTRRQASVAGGRSLLFDNHHVAVVDGHQVLAELQDSAEHAVRRREGVLVGAALHGGQALGLLLLAVARRLLDLHDDAAVLLHDLQDQHVDDTDQRAVGAAHDRGL
eukprot:CAMPEP_0183537142 /NCGR_PEP_ID=MMETSP0371-20130417/28728_1 /TAXON_ID=268820 /ORGANISM="Peridinium aciculiferum, Strain PAER-2" /LENGTH=170 /DNA_ID=CAMNT_0025737823 /DNA_START=101 /DNA_END=610 /DNA_ORIENTATION=+